MRKEIGITVPYRKVNTMPNEDIEVLAVTMSYLHDRGFTKDQVKKAVDAWWAVKKDKK
jgi:hypothetical protein